MQDRNRNHAGADTLPPNRQILDDAAVWREALAAQWLSAAEVSAKLSLKPCSGGHHASQLRRNGQILGVYVTHPAPSYRYPPWQFRPDGQPIDHLAEILRILREFGPFEREPEGLRRTTGWGEAEWFLSPHALLDGIAPSSALSATPARVLRAAQMELQADTSQGSAC